MLESYLALGGNEVVNAARSYGYAWTAGCRATWLSDPGCSTLAEAQADTPYNYANITNAPWYDPDVPESTGFLGVYGLEISNLSDSTREAGVTQKTGDGAKTTSYRHGSREMRVRVWLTASSGDAMEYGMTWLRNVLEPDACGIHGGTCGEAEMAFFVDCPPARRTVNVAELYPSDLLYPSDELFPGAFTTGPIPEGDETYFPYVDTYRRFLHSVRCVSGPFKVQEAISTNGKFKGRLVEFSLLAEVPFVFGLPKELEVPPLVPSVVQDIAYNLAPYPSAELSAGTVVTATNYCPNPSVEVNATGYSTTVVPPSSPNPASMITSGRSDDIAAAGSWSYRTRLDASSYASDWGGTAYIQVDTPAVDLTLIPADTRLSFSAWGAALFLAGAGSPETGGGYMHDMAASAVFTGGAGGTVPLNGGTVDYDGTVFEKESVPIPAGATSVRIRFRFDLHWSSTSPGAPVPTATDVRFYVDAVAVTNP